MLERAKKFTQEWRVLLLTVSGVSLLIFGLRSLGLFQPLAWSGLDLLFKTRPPEDPDNRIVVVALEEADIQRYKQWPVSDRLLARLLNKIKSQNPRVIGLDLHRDIPVPPGYEELARVFQTTPNLIGIEKAAGDEFYPTIAPPPILGKLGQVGASDLVIDPDGVLRRAILFPRTDEDPSLPSFGLAVALKYLDKEGVEPKASPDGGWLKLGNRVFYPIDKNEGGYIDVGTAEYQIMLNYRSGRQPFKKVTFTEVLENVIPPDIFKDKIVLIGSRAISLKDYFFTPYSKGEQSSPILTYGVEINGYISSQIISSVLDSRPLLKSLPEPLEYVWIFGWILIPSVWAWQWRNIKDAIKLFLIVSLGSVILIILLLAIVYLAFLHAWWIPAVSPLLGLSLSTIFMSFAIYITRIQEANLTLEQKIQEKTEKLKSYTQQLESTLRQLESTRMLILAREKQAYLGSISTGIAHEIINPVNNIRNFADLLLQQEESIGQSINYVLTTLQSDESEHIAETLELMVEMTGVIKEETRRLNLIVQSFLPQPVSGALKPKSINIHELLDTVQRLVINSKRIDDDDFQVIVITHYDNSLQKIKIVVSEITQALVNIIDNAYYALYEKYSITYDFEPMITIITKNLEGMVEISIEDNGIGIPPELEDKIFRPFVTTKTPGEGTGVGLSIAHDIIVVRHRGELKFETQPGEYTKFIIALPKLP